MEWTRDVIEEIGGINLYCFVNNACTFFYDIAGLLPLRVVTEHSNNLFERIINGGDVVSWPEITSAEQISIQKVDSSSVWGVFSPRIQIFDCSVEICLQIFINSKAVEIGNRNTIYYYTPHVGNKYGIASSSDGSPQIQGGIIAHERGHASAFFDVVVSGMKSEVESYGSKSLTPADKSHIMATYEKLLKDADHLSGERANERHLNWHRSNGYKIMTK